MGCRGEDNAGEIGVGVGFDEFGRGGHDHYGVDATRVVPKVEVCEFFVDTSRGMQGSSFEEILGIGGCGG
jgi:hypothetical protein